MTDAMCTGYYPNDPLPGPRKMIIDTTEIHTRDSQEYVGCVEKVSEDGAITVVLENGRRGLVQPNGMFTVDTAPYLVALFDGVEEELGEPYIVMQIVDGRQIAWVPDGDGVLRRLRALLLDAEVLIPE